MYGFSGLYGQAYGLNFSPSGTTFDPRGIRSPGQMLLDTRERQDWRVVVEEELPPEELPPVSSGPSPWAILAGVTVAVGVVGGAVYLLRRKK